MIMAELFYSNVIELIYSFSFCIHLIMLCHLTKGCTNTPENLAIAEICHSPLALYPKIDKKIQLNAEMDFFTFFTIILIWNLHSCSYTAIRCQKRLFRVLTKKAKSNCSFSWDIQWKKEEKNPLHRNYYSFFRSQKRILEQI